MRCLQHAIGQTLDHAYAHHIQRLMVTGNFALLAGIDPDEVDAWYLGVYIDALEWVEITNTRGMSQFADGGIVGTKPYVSSANYMHKMGPHCASCQIQATGQNRRRRLPLQQPVLALPRPQPRIAGAQPAHRHGVPNLGQDAADAQQQALLDRGDAVLANLENL